MATSLFVAVLFMLGSSMVLVIQRIFREFESSVDEDAWGHARHLHPWTKKGDRRFRTQVDRVKGAGSLQWS
jgi:hypothetical protein